MTEPPDSELWEQAVAGSGEAFGQLFDRHSRAEDTELELFGYDANGEIVPQR